MRPAIFGILLVCSSCVKQDPLFCASTADCTDPALPYCDVEGAFPASEGIGKTCIPDPFPDGGPSTACDPGAFVECSDEDTAVYCDEAGAELVALDCEAECDAAQSGCYCEPGSSTCSGDVSLSCDASGVPRVRSCALGCNDTGERCVDVDPSNGLGAFLDMADDGPVVVLTDGAVIDTDRGTIENGDGSAVAIPTFDLPAPADGVEIRIFAVKSITIGDATATGSRALAILSDDEILIQGELRADSGRGPSGACDGGRSNCDGDGDFCAGPGGGGFGTAGGRGGSAAAGDTVLISGANGLASGNPQLVPLRGGCAGGRLSTDLKAGNGGGALQLVSRTSIRIADGSGGFISASGKGGAAASGGGAGGGVLLEAPRVFVPSGTGVVANGGGGGCSSAAGENGQLSSTPAQGAICPASSAGDGGDGGTTGVGTTGESATGTGARAGAGGGGTGRIRVNVPSPAAFRNFGLVSPAPSVGALATR